MRYVASELERILSEERKMAFLAGPRQVGKTTLAKQLLGNRPVLQHYFTWDSVTHRKKILKNPDQFWSSGLPSPDGRPFRIVLDEIHKYPRWKRFLKGLFDVSGHELELIVTGSGRLDIYQKGGDSLFGRYALNRLHPFTVGEYLSEGRQDMIKPDDFLGAISSKPLDPSSLTAVETLETLTGFPEPLFAGTEERLRRWRRAHRDLILREDLRDLTRIRDLGLVDALVELLPDKIGSPLSINSLREDLGVAFGTVKQWLEALIRLYYLFEIRPYAGTLARTLHKETKVYLYDTSEIDNPAARFENMVALHLRKLCDAWNDRGFGEFKLHYVRDKEKREVDFLIVSDKKPFFLLEAKLSENVIDSSLRYFRDRLSPRYCAQVVHHLPAHQERKTEGISVISAARLLALI